MQYITHNDGPIFTVLDRSQRRVAVIEKCNYRFDDYGHYTISVKSADTINAIVEREFQSDSMPSVAFNTHNECIVGMSTGKIAILYNVERNVVLLKYHYERDVMATILDSICMHIAIFIGHDTMQVYNIYNPFSILVDISDRVDLSVTAFSANSKYLLNATSGQGSNMKSVIRLWDLSDNYKLIEHGHEYLISCAIFNPKETCIIYAAGGMLYQYDIDTETVTKLSGKETKSTITAVVCNNDTVLWGCMNGSVFIRRGDRAAVRIFSDFPVDAIISLSINNSGGILYITYEEGDDNKLQCLYIRREPWRPCFHFDYCKEFRRLVEVTLVLAKRLQLERDDLPILPTEIWYLIISMYSYNDTLHIAD